MIISASRRTDIPAFYSDWMMARLREGFCLVPNPMNKKQISQISLLPKDVEAIVFWSKNPKPILPYLDEIDKFGHRYYFQFTLNNYSTLFEPKVPPLSSRIATFQQLSNMVGPKRVVWRYDPIIISSISGYDFHRTTFERLAKQLAGYTSRVVISIVDLYRKTSRRFQPLEKQGIEIDYKPEVSGQLLDLLHGMALTAKYHDLEILSCAEECDYSNLGICPGRCIDGELIDSIWHIQGNWKKDPGQRSACGCIVSRDIGTPDTCLHNCVYCYATVSENAAANNRKKHDPNSPLLVGQVDEQFKLKTNSQLQLFK